MKDEIKEILDNLKYCKEHDEENNYYPEDIFSKEDPYKNAYETTMIANKMLEEKYKDYKSRNEKAIEYINSTDFRYDEQYKKKDILLNILNVYDKPIEEKKIPEKLPKSVIDNACSSKDMRLIANTLNQVIDYLKSKGE